MGSRIGKVIQEDTGVCRSSSALWFIESDLPEIRQIYGSYLPPSYLRAGEGLVAKDFSFPADAVIPKMVSVSIDRKFMNRLHSLGERISPESFMSTANSVKIRAEGNGAVVYTPYFSGFYINEVAYSILKLCNRKLKVGQIASELKCDIDVVIDFLARCLALGLINVCAE